MGHGENSYFTLKLISIILLSTHFPDIVGLLQILELRHGVVSKSLVQRPISKLIPYIHVCSLLHQKLSRKKKTTHTHMIICCSGVMLGAAINKTAHTHDYLNFLRGNEGLAAIMKTKEETS